MDWFISLFWGKIRASWPFLIFNLEDRENGKGFKKKDWLIEQCSYICHGHTAPTNFSSLRLYRINLYVIVIIIINNHNNMYNGTICTHTHSHFKNVILIVSVDVKLAHKPMTTYTRHKYSHSDIQTALRAAVTHI